MKKSISVCGLLILAGNTVDAQELLPYHRRAIVRCGIPAVPPLPQNSSNPVTKGSLPGVMVPISTAPLPLDLRSPTVQGGESLLAIPTKFWTLSSAEIRNEHCSIRDVHFWVNTGGEARLSLSAKQYPFTEPSRSALPAARLLRNRFFVTVRAIGGLPGGVGATTSPEPINGPEMFTFHADPFWVEREEVRNISFQKTLDCSDIKRVNMVSHLLVDFSIE